MNGGAFKGPKGFSSFFLLPILAQCRLYSNTLTFHNRPSTLPWQTFYSTLSTGTLSHGQVSIVVFSRKGAYLLFSIRIPKPYFNKDGGRPCLPRMCCLGRLYILSGYSPWLPVQGRLGIPTYPSSSWTGRRQSDCCCSLFDGQRPGLVFYVGSWVHWHLLG